MGSLDEVVEMCRIDERMVPTIDFGHLHARTEGGLRDAGAFRRVFDAVADGLGVERMRSMHIHMSSIEYTAGGERRHRDMGEEGFGPDYRILIDTICEKKAEPVVICESHSDRTADSVRMMEYYRTICPGGK
jgi:deoxyribonuclease-4